jgi:hypothetical protein
MVHSSNAPHHARQLQHLSAMIQRCFMLCCALLSIASPIPVPKERDLTVAQTKVQTEQIVHTTRAKRLCGPSKGPAGLQCAASADFCLCLGSRRERTSYLCLQARL